MRIDPSWAAALGSAALLWACDAVTDRDDLASSLSGRQFLSESVEGRELVPGTEIRLSFDDSELSAYAGCNHIGGAYHIAGGVLRVDGLGSTEIGCDAALHDQDSWLSDLLSSSPTLDLDEPRLTISGEDVTLTLVDREVASPDRPLVGTHWIGNGAGDGNAISFGPGSDLVTVDFAEDGEFTVFTACEHGVGTFSADATRITFEEIAYDGTVCAQVSQVAVSAQVMAVLDGSPVTFEIEEANLELRRDERLLLFRADE